MKNSTDNDLDLPLCRVNAAKKHVPLTHAEASEMVCMRLTDLGGKGLNPYSIQFKPKERSSVSTSASDAVRPKQFPLKSTFFGTQSIYSFTGKLRLT